jgi:hypothetical protein
MESFGSSVLEVNRAKSKSAMAFLTLSFHGLPDGRRRDDGQPWNVGL